MAGGKTGGLKFKEKNAWGIGEKIGFSPISLEKRGQGSKGVKETRVSNSGKPYRKILVKGLCEPLSFDVLHKKSGQAVAITGLAFKYSRRLSPLM